MFRICGTVSSVSMCTRVHENSTSASRTPRKFYKINCKVNTIIRYHCKIWGFLFCLNNSHLFIYRFTGCLDLHYLFIYLFTGCLDLHCGTWLLLLLWVPEPPGSQAEAHRLSCPLPHGIRALPPGTEPPSPALEGGFSMTAPPGKAPKILVFIPVFCYVYGWINGQIGRYINSCINA